MQKIRSDLWETRTDTPFPGLMTHAYLWTQPERNVLFYSTAGDADFDAIERLGGIKDHFLSHKHEASPVLARIADRFGSRLHAPAAEAAEISRHAHLDVPLEGRRAHGAGLEAIPTPGHTPGSMCYLVSGVDGGTYLFTGDTTYVGNSGKWTTFLVSDSDPAALRSSLERGDYQRVAPGDRRERARGPSLVNLYCGSAGKLARQNLTSADRNRNPLCRNRKRLRLLVTRHIRFRRIPHVVVSVGGHVGTVATA
ncbi:MBL fold metallo-hydrolase [Mycobacterium asiaticum]|uniref:MBL fold metallo-hydrolase n=1 Tax=Mycobacterium asiaticum TaxID=1790 RepID=UPI0026BB2399